MATKSGTHGDGAFLRTYLNRGQSFKNSTLAAGSLATGTVLGKVLFGDVTVTAGGANTGNGTFAATPVTTDKTVPGDYTLIISEAATDGGSWVLRDPTGNVVDLGFVGIAAAGGHLTFTLEDGATDFAVGDSFTISVAEGSLKHKIIDKDATDGTQLADAILLTAADASLAEQPIVVVDALAEACADDVVWPTGADALSTAQKDAAIERLALKHLQIR